jgi:sigma-B regulation protein RsbU (phosphoserine phosphatase)
MTETLFNMAPCGCFAFMDDGTLQEVNQTLCTLLGYEKEELKGKSVETLFTLPTRIFYQTHLFPLIKMQGFAEEIFLSLLTKNKQHLPVLLNAKRIELEGTVFTSCAFIVVHNRKKFEDELVAARKAAEAALRENSELAKAKSDLQQRAEQLDAQIQLVNKQNNELRQLNQVMTHDLREPLRKILVYTERLQNSLPKEKTTADVYKHFHKLSKASVQMQTIVSGLQQYIWLNDTACNFEQINLNEIVKRAAEKIKESLGADVLVLQSQTLPAIEADAEQMELLFYHIMANAVKFKKEEKATVTIAATIIQQNKFKAVEDKYKYEDFVKLEIRDNGVGFDPAFSNHVFDLFKRLHYTEGPGLGLALCKKIVENHYGSVKADSKINEHTTITVTLPLVQFYK